MEVFSEKPQFQFLRWPMETDRDRHLGGPLRTHVGV